MLALATGFDLCQTLSRWPQPDGWTGVGFAATIAGLFVGGFALWLTWRIYKWTNESDAERHEELTFALDELRRRGESPPSRDTAPEADLSGLPDEARERLQTLLEGDERIIRFTRTGTGKGAHAWLAMTTKGKVLRAYRGGRAGGWHVKVLY